MSTYYITKKQLFQMFKDTIYSYNRKMQFKPYNEIYEKLKDFAIPEEFDLVVGIARGGIVPALLLSGFLQKELAFIWLKYRDETGDICYEKPQLMKECNFDFFGKRILLVDDRTRTGSTFDAAKNFLKGAASIKTFAVNGSADYFLYNEECFVFPWKT